MAPTTHAHADPARVLTIILGGGQGARLFPLTRGLAGCNRWRRSRAEFLDYS